MENTPFERRQQTRQEPQQPPQQSMFDLLGARLADNRAMEEPPKNSWQAQANAQAMRQSGRL